MTQDKKAFTLLELTVVIIIIGILASLGITQYSKSVERSRGAEAYTVLAHIKELAATYYINYGNLTGLTGDYCGIGNISGQTPGLYGTSTVGGQGNGARGCCMPTHYFAYAVNAATAGSRFLAYAYRCNNAPGNARGKPPDVDSATQQWNIYVDADFANNTEIWNKSGLNVATNPY